MSVNSLSVTEDANTGWVGGWWWHCTGHVKPKRQWLRCTYRAWLYLKRYAPSVNINFKLLRMMMKITENETNRKICHNSMEFIITIFIFPLITNLTPDTQYIAKRGKRRDEEDQPTQDTERHNRQDSSCESTHPDPTSNPTSNLCYVQGIILYFTHNINLIRT